MIKADLEFSTLESWYWDVSDPFLQVLVSVLVLKPQSLGLGLGFGTSESWSWSWDLGPWRLGLRHAWSVKLRQNKTRTLNYNDTTFKVLNPLLEKVFCLPATSAPVERILATVVCWCGQTGLEWVTTRCHSWSTCDATISCKFSCCCTVVISL